MSGRVRLAAAHSGGMWNANGNAARRCRLDGALGETDRGHQ